MRASVAGAAAGAMLWIGPALALTPSTLPFADDFDGYLGGQPLRDLGAYGWGASSADVVIQDAVTQASSPLAVRLPGYTRASNVVVSAAVTNVWTDLYVRDTERMRAAPDVSTNMSVLLYVGTNGYAVIYNAAGSAWDVCSNDVWGAAVGPLTSEWVRVSIHQNYQTRRTALFVEGHLLRQELDFVAPNATYSLLRLDSGYRTATYLDTLAVSLEPPPTLTADGDGDGVPDALDIQRFGDVPETFVVAHGGDYDTIQAALDQARERDTIHITPGTYTGDVAIADAVLFTGGAFTNRGAATLAAGLTIEWPGSADIGDLTLAAAAELTVPGDLTCTALALGDGSMLNVGGRLVCTTLAMSNLSTLNVTGDLACASVALGDGSILNVGGSLYGGSVTTAPDSVLTLGGTLQCTGAFTLGANSMVTLSAGSQAAAGEVHVGADATLRIDQAVVSFGQLVISAGGRVVVEDGTVQIGDLDLAGTFVIDDRWLAGWVPASLPFEDGFEKYAEGTRLTQLGYFGWAASGSGVVVQSAVKQAGARAAELPAYTQLSNAVNAVGIAKVWTELHVRESVHMRAAPDVNTNMTVMFFIDTNGHAVVYDKAAAQWDVCDTDVFESAAPTVPANGWAHIGIHQDFSKAQAAVFLNGRLLRERLPFLHPASGHTGLRLDSGYAWPTYVDNVLIGEELPGSLTNDWDRDGVFDALEIHLHGTVTAYPPRGAVFKFR